MYSSRTSCPRKVRASIPPLSGKHPDFWLQSQNSQGVQQETQDPGCGASGRENTKAGVHPSVPSGSPGTTAAPNVLDMCNPRAPPSVAPEHCRVWPPIAQSKGNRPLLVPQSLLQLLSSCNYSLPGGGIPSQGTLGFLQEADQTQFAPFSVPGSWGKLGVGSGLPQEISRSCQTRAAFFPPGPTLGDPGDPPTKFSWPQSPPNLHVSSGVPIIQQLRKEGPQEVSEKSGTFCIA